MERLPKTVVKKIIAWIMVSALFLPSALDVITWAGHASLEDQPRVQEIVIHTAEILETVEKWQGAEAASLLKGSLEGEPTEIGGFELPDQPQSEPSPEDDFADEYTVEKVAPPKVVVMEDGTLLTSESVEESEAFEQKFKLDKDLITFIEDKLVLPYQDEQSVITKKALLERLEGKWLVKVEEEEAYQAIIVLDPETYELSAALINNTEEELQLKLQVIDSTGNELSRTDIFSIIQKASKQTLTPEEWERYKYTENIEVEVLSLSLSKENPEAAGDDENLEQSEDPIEEESQIEEESSIPQESLEEPASSKEQSEEESTDEDQQQHEDTANSRQQEESAYIEESTEEEIIEASPEDLGEEVVTEYETINEADDGDDVGGTEEDSGSDDDDAQYYIATRQIELNAEVVTGETEQQDATDGAEQETEDEPADSKAAEIEGIYTQLEESSAYSDENTAYSEESSIPDEQQGTAISEDEGESSQAEEEFDQPNATIEEPGQQIIEVEAIVVEKEEVEFDEKETEQIYTVPENSFLITTFGIYAMSYNVTYPADNNVRIYGPSGLKFRTIVTGLDGDDEPISPPATTNVYEGTIPSGKNYVDINYKPYAASQAIGISRYIVVQANINSAWKQIARFSAKQVKLLPPADFEVSGLVSRSKLATVDDSQQKKKPVVMFHGFKLQVNAPENTTFRLDYTPTSLISPYQGETFKVPAGQDYVDYWFYGRAPAGDYICYYYLKEIRSDGSERLVGTFNARRTRESEDPYMSSSKQDAFRLYRIGNIIPSAGTTIDFANTDYDTCNVAFNYGDPAMSVTAKAPGLSGSWYTYKVTDINGVPYAGPVNIGGSEATVQNGVFTLQQDQTALLNRNTQKTYIVSQIAQSDANIRLLRVLANGVVIKKSGFSKTVNLAAGEDMAEAVFVNVDSGDELVGGVRMAKRAWRIDETSPYRYDVELTVTGKSAAIEDESPVVEVLMVLDTSGSMDDEGRWSNARQAAGNMAASLLARNPQNRISVITYSDTAAVQEDWTNDSGLPARIKSMSRVGSGTQYAEGFIKASEQLQSSNPAAIRYVVYMSDGDTITDTVVMEGINAAMGLNRMYPDVSILTMGVGSGVNSYVLNPGGSYRYNDSYAQASTSAALETAFKAFTNIILKNYEHPMVEDYLSDYVSLEGGISSIKGWYCNKNIPGHTHDDSCWKEIADTFYYDSSTKKITWNPRTYDLASNGGVAKLNSWYTYRMTYQLKVDNYDENYQNIGDDDTGTHSNNLGWYSSKEAILYISGSEMDMFPMPVVQTQYKNFTQVLNIINAGEQSDLVAGTKFVLKNSYGTVIYGGDGQLVTNSGGEASIPLSLLATAVEANGGSLELELYATETATNYRLPEGRLAKFTVTRVGSMYFIQHDAQSRDQIVTSDATSYDQDTSTLTVNSKMKFMASTLILTAKGENNQPLAGVTYTLVKQGAPSQTITLVTGPDGMASHIFQEAQAGKWYLTETSMGSNNMYALKTGNLASISVESTNISFSDAVSAVTGAGGNITVQSQYKSTTGSHVTLKKVISNDKTDSTAFSFTFQPENGGLPSKTMSSVVANAAAVNVEGLRYGETYTVSEAAKIGYSQEALVVKVGGVEQSQPKLTVTPGQNIEIIATNSNNVTTSVDGRVKIKTTVDGDSGDNTTFQVSFYRGGTVLEKTQGVAAGPDFAGVDALQIGKTYRVEEFIPANYESNPIIKINGETKNTFVVPATGTVEIEIINTQKAMSDAVTVEKIVSNDNNDHSGFEIVFTPAYGAVVKKTVTANMGAVSVADGGIPATGSLQAGRTYTITETAKTNYTNTQIEVWIDDEKQTDPKFKLTDGKPVRIVVTNTNITTTGSQNLVTLQKIVQGDSADDGSFKVNFTLAGSTTPLEKTITAGTAVNVSGLQIGKKYTVEEQEHSGYEQISIKIDNAVVPGDIFTVPETGTVEIVITNGGKTSTGSDNKVLLKKTVDNDSADTGSFTIRFQRQNSSDLPIDKVVTAGDTISVDGLRVGKTYKVSEPAPGASYEYKKIIIDNVEKDTFTVPSSGTVNIQVVNSSKTTKLTDAFVTLKKTVENDAMDYSEFPVVFTLVDNSKVSLTCTLAANAATATNVAGLQIGKTYKVSEPKPGANYSLSKIIINGDDSLDTFTVSESTPVEIEVVNKNKVVTEADGRVVIKHIISNDLTDHNTFNIFFKLSGVETIVTKEVTANSDFAGVKDLQIGKTYYVSEAVTNSNYEFESIIINNNPVPGNAFTVPDEGVISIIVTYKSKVTKANESTVTLKKVVSDDPGDQNSFKVRFTLSGSSAFVEKTVNANGAAINVDDLHLGKTYTISEVLNEDMYSMSGITVGGIIASTITVGGSDQEVIVTNSSKVSTGSDGKENVTLRTIVSNDPLDITHNVDVRFALKPSLTKVTDVPLTTGAAATEVVDLQIGKTYVISDISADPAYELDYISVDGVRAAGSTAEITVPVSGSVPVIVAVKNKVTTDDNTDPSTYQLITLEKTITADTSTQNPVTVRFVHQGGGPDVPVTIKSNEGPVNVTGLQIGKTYKIVEDVPADYQDNPAITVDSVTTDTVIVPTSGTKAIVINNTYDTSSNKVTVKVEVNGDPNDRTVFDVDFTDSASSLITKQVTAHSAAVNSGITTAETYTVAVQPKAGYTNYKIYVTEKTGLETELELDTFTFTTNDWYVRITCDPVLSDSSTNKWVELSALVENDPSDTAVPFNVNFSLNGIIHETHSATTNATYGAVTDLQLGKTYDMEITGLNSKYQVSEIMVDNVVSDDKKVTIPTSAPSVKIQIKLRNITSTESQPLVTLEKTTSDDPGNSANFTVNFTLKDSSPPIVVSKTIQANSGAVNMAGLQIGKTYVITEADPGSGYNTPTITVGGSPASEVTVPVAMTQAVVVDNTSVTTIATDEYVKLKKTVTNDSSDQGYFTIVFTLKGSTPPVVVPYTAQANVVTPPDDFKNVPGLQIGKTYIVTETVPANYTLGNILIDGVSKNHFTVDPLNPVEIEIKNINNTTNTSNSSVKVQTEVINNSQDNTIFEIVFTPTGGGTALPIDITSGAAAAKVPGLMIGKEYAVSVNFAGKPYELDEIIVGGTTGTGLIVPAIGTDILVEVKIKNLVTGNLESSPATVTIKKTVTNNTTDDGTFNIRFTPTGGGSSVLVEDVVANATAIKVPNLMIGREYVVSEEARASYNFNRIEINGDAKTTFTIDPDAPSAIEVFNDRKTADDKITLSKVVTGDAGDYSTFNIKFTPQGGGMVKNQTVEANKTPIGVEGLQVGKTYTVSEDIPSAYTQTSIVITEDSSPISGTSFTVDESKEVHVTVTNASKKTTGSDNKVQLKAVVGNDSSDTTPDFDVYFTLESDSGSTPVISNVQAGDSFVSVENLQIGKTYIVSIPTPNSKYRVDHFEIKTGATNETKTRFTVPETGTVEIVAFTQNKTTTEAQGLVRVRKVLEDDNIEGSPTFNIVFTHADHPGDATKTITKTVTANAPYSMGAVAGLQIGKSYYVSESSAGDYQLLSITTEDRSIDLTNGTNTFIVPETGGVEIVVTNQPKGTTPSDSNVTLKALVGNDSTDNAEFDITFTLKGSSATFKTKTVQAGAAAVNVEDLQIGKTYIISQNLSTSRYEQSSITVGGDNTTEIKVPASGIKPVVVTNIAKTTQSTDRLVTLQHIVTNDENDSTYFDIPFILAGDNTSVIKTIRASDKVQNVEGLQPGKYYTVKFPTTANENYTHTRIEVNGEAKDPATFQVPTVGTVEIKIFSETKTTKTTDNYVKLEKVVANDDNDNNDFTVRFTLINSDQYIETTVKAGETAANVKDLQLGKVYRISELVDSNRYIINGVSVDEISGATLKVETDKSQKVTITNTNKATSSSNSSSKVTLKRVISNDTDDHATTTVRFTLETDPDIFVDKTILANSAVVNIDGLLIGKTYIIESPTGDNYVRESITVNNTDTGGKVTVPANGSAAVVITDKNKVTTTDDSLVTLKKLVDNDNADQNSFEVVFTPADGSAAPIVTAHVAANNTEAVKVGGLLIGKTYIVSETVPGNYESGYTVKVNNTAGNTLTVPKTGTIPVEITNTRASSSGNAVMVSKVVDNNNLDNQTFTVKFTAQSDGTEITRTITANSAAQAVSGLLIGETYTVSEVASANYTQQSIVITELGQAINGDTFTLVDGRNVLITITNRNKVTNTATSPVTVKTSVKNNPADTSSFAVTFTMVDNSSISKTVTAGAAPVKVADLQIGKTYQITQPSLGINYIQDRTLVNGSDDSTFTVSSAPTEIQVINRNKVVSETSGHVTVEAKVVNNTADTSSFNLQFELVDAPPTNDVDNPNPKTVTVTAGAAAVTLNDLIVGKTYKVLQPSLDENSNYEQAAIYVNDVKTDTFTASASENIAIKVNNRNKESTSESSHVTLKKVVSNHQTDTTNFTIRFTMTDNPANEIVYSVNANQPAIKVSGLLVGKTYNISEDGPVANYTNPEIKVNGTAQTTVTVQKGQTFNVVASSDNETTTLADNVVTLKARVEGDNLSTTPITVRFQLEGAHPVDKTVTAGDNTPENVAGLQYGKTYELSMLAGSNYKISRITVGGQPANSVTIVRGQSQPVEVVVTHRLTGDEDDEGQAKAAVTLQKLVENDSHDPTSFEVLFTSEESGHQVSKNILASSGAVNVNGLRYGETYVVSESPNPHYENISMKVNGVDTNRVTVIRGRTMAVVSTSRNYVTVEGDDLVKLKKIIDDGGSKKDREEKFTIFFTLENNAAERLEYKDLTVDSIIDAAGLQIGKTYIVSEGYSDNYQLAEVIVDGKSSRNKTVTIPDMGTMEIQAVNAHKRTSGNEGHIKVEIENDKHSDDTFTFVFTEIDGTDVVEITVKANDEVPFPPLKDGKDYIVTVNGHPNYNMKQPMVNSQPENTFTATDDEDVNISVSADRKIIDPDDITFETVIVPKEGEELPPGLSDDFEIIFTPSTPGADPIVVIVDGNGNLVSDSPPLKVGETYEVTSKVPDGYENSIIVIGINGNENNGNSFTVREDEEVNISFTSTCTKSSSQSDHDYSGSHRRDKDRYHAGWGSDGGSGTGIPKQPEASANSSGGVGSQPAAWNQAPWDEKDIPMTGGIPIEAGGILGLLLLLIGLIFRRKEKRDQHNG